MSEIEADVTATLQHPAARPPALDAHGATRARRSGAIPDLRDVDRGTAEIPQKWRR